VLVINGLWECSTNGMNEHMELSRKVKIIKGVMGDGAD